MNRKTIGLTVLALALLSGFSLLASQTTVQGPKQEKAQQWEYKIISVTDSEFGGNKVDQEFNKLGADGWEFTQILVSRGSAPAGEGRSLSNTSCFLFRRAKK